MSGERWHKTTMRNMSLRCLGWPSATECLSRSMVTRARAPAAHRQAGLRTIGQQGAHEVEPALLRRGPLRLRPAGPRAMPQVGVAVKAMQTPARAGSWEERRCAIRRRQARRVPNAVRSGGGKRAVPARTCAAAGRPRGSARPPARPPRLPPPTAPAGHGLPGPATAGLSG
jgi:hypothetical protein